MFLDGLSFLSFWLFFILPILISGAESRHPRPRSNGVWCFAVGAYSKVDLDRNISILKTFRPRAAYNLEVQMIMVCSLCPIIWITSPCNPLGCRPPGPDIQFRAHNDPSHPYTRPARPYQMKEIFDTVQSVQVAFNGKNLLNDL